MLLEPTTVVAQAWEHIAAIGRRTFWDPRTVLVVGAGPIGLLAALVAALPRPAGPTSPRLAVDRCAADVGQRVYLTVWIVSVLAAVRALFGNGGFKVAVLAIIPIILLAPPALVGVRAALGRPIAPASGEPGTVVSPSADDSGRQ